MGNHSDISAISIEKAPSKLTATLKVLGVRSDGYHLLEAIAGPLSAPLDTVSVTAGSVSPGEGRSIKPRLCFSQNRTLDPSASRIDIPLDAGNLAVAAALAVFEAAGSPADLVRYEPTPVATPGERPWRIHVDKEIPAGGGLGGGSADAAAVIRQLGAALGLSEAGQLEVAARLGADVPICWANRTMIMRGAGEVLEPAPELPSVAVVVATPAISLSTPAVYRAWDELGGPIGADVPAPRAWDGALQHLRNDLEPAAHHVSPELAGFARLVRSFGCSATLAGSGASYAIWARDDREAKRVADELRSRSDAHVWVSQFPAPAQ